MIDRRALRERLQELRGVRVTAWPLALLVAVSSLSTLGVVLGAGGGGPSQAEAAALLRGAPIEVRRAAGIAPDGTTTAAAGATAGDDASATGDAKADASGDDGDTASATADASADPAASTDDAATDGAGDTTTDDTPTTPSTAPPVGSKVQHVFVISLHSPGYDATFGPAAAGSYLVKTLAPKGVLLSGYGLLGTATLPNGVALLGGQPPNPLTTQECPTYADFPAGTKAAQDGTIDASGCVYPIDALTLPDQLGSAGHDWRAYVQGMGDGRTCRRPGPGEADPTLSADPAVGARPDDPYATRKNPVAYFHTLVDLGDCAKNDVGLDVLDHDLRRRADTPALSLIAPDLCHDGSREDCGTTGAAAADAFLAGVVPKILASPAYRAAGLLVVTYDGAPAAAAGATKDATAAALRTGAVLVSPWTAGGTTDATAASPYALLRTVEDLFGLKHLGAAQGVSVPTFAPLALGQAAAPPDN
ncbi:alkaline phosphatase family protein [Patulibacter sp. NPDC049589]|uniref:alkaline phosphatase family protein n=1 Tax=Patulibacter sp. NPDC049589 TaxID=3154731 RepID=UPI003436ACD2